MIIHDKIWVAINPKRDLLAYMTHYKEDKAFESRKLTGLSWSEIKEEEALVYDNTPVKGFVISESVSRWSTSNKLFRVIDPRGFIVEVPTGNISTLLHHCNVHKGVVQEECVWGREGANHVLLPKNSDPYIKAYADTKTLEEKVSLTKLDKGDIVKFGLEGSEYVYLGRYKCLWELTIKQAEEKHENSWYSIRWKRKETDISIETGEFLDIKYRFLFKKLKDKNINCRNMMETSGKCIKLNKTSQDVKVSDNYEGIYRTNELVKYIEDLGYKYYEEEEDGKYISSRVKELIEKENK